MSSIPPSELSKEIQKYLQEYKEEIDEDVQDETDKAIASAKSELRSISPKNTGNYASGWAVKSQKYSNGYYKVIWNRKAYQLTHLLEFGHATRNGGRTKAQPHIRPTEEKYKTRFTESLERRIKK
jgi:HK97 gp10 family phage protein